jgi:hypothetical protein
MNRREFLKVGGTLSTALIFFSSPFKGFVPKATLSVAGGKSYRGTANGEVHVSEDAGRTWRLHTRFGREYTILDVFPGRNGQIYLIAGYKGRSFHLSLALDEKFWTSEPITFATLLNMA